MHTDVQLLLPHSFTNSKSASRWMHTVLSCAGFVASITPTLKTPHILLLLLLLGDTIHRIPAPFVDLLNSSAVLPHK